MLLRALVVWLVLIAVEAVHGTFRTLVLEPRVGDFTARQFSVLTGSILILMVTYLFIDWIGAKSGSQLTNVGVVWVLLTLSFEIGIGRFVAGYSWDRVVSDFNLMAGGFLGVGMLILALAPRIAYSVRRVRASKIERTRTLPGDNFIATPIGSITHAITINCGTKGLWPWLVQMGAGRAGWYSYDFLDNGRQRSAKRIVPDLQTISVGKVFPAVPGATDGFILLAHEAERHLVLGAFPFDGSYAVTWAFVLESQGITSTRLIVRARANTGYRGLPLWLIRPVHFVMQRKQLLGIARRAESAVKKVEEMEALPA